MLNQTNKKNATPDIIENQKVRAEHDGHTWSLLPKTFRLLISCLSFANYVTADSACTNILY